jgi:uncharacterized coiled-coil protein SlyX
MTDDTMDIDVATQVLHASSVSLGGDDYAVKNSDRESFIYKIFTKIEFGHDDVMDPKTIRDRVMGLSDAIGKSTRGDSDSTYLATIDGKRIDMQSSPTNPKEFQASVNWTINEGRQRYASTTIMLHSAVRFSALKRRILSFLKENRIYIKPNFTKSSLEEIVRVAIIPFMNSDITFRQGFSTELNQKLQEVVNWKDDDFKHKYPCINDDFAFDVVVSKTEERMTFQKETIATFILLVECPRSQSLLCRSILQEAFNLMSPTDDGPSRYTCVPLVLKNPKKYPKGPATVFQLLKSHNRFLEEFKSFQIKGVHRTTMAILKPTIMMDCPAINAIESTFMTDDCGKWTIGSTKARIKEAQEWIDDNLPRLMDITSPDNKPPVPTAVVPQRIIFHAEVSDLQMDHLVAISGISISTQPTVNAWGSPPLIPPTQPSPSETPSASLTKMMSELITKVNVLDSKLTAHLTTIAQNKSTISALESTLTIQQKTIAHNKSTILALQSALTIQQTTIDQNNSKISALSAQVLHLPSALDESITDLKLQSTKPAVPITELTSQVDAHEDTIASIHDRVDVLEPSISNQLVHLNAALPPLHDVVQAGGFAALIQKTLLEFDPTLPSVSTKLSTTKKRPTPPSPFSRKGQPSPVRVRRDKPTSNSVRL